MDFQSIIIAVLFAWTLVQGLCLLAKISSSKSVGKRLPPGPVPLPVIGNLHFLGEQPHKSLARLAQKYGPVMNLKLGMLNTVVISSSAMAQQALQKQDLAFSTHRSIPNALLANNHSQFSVTLLPVASKWRALRKIMNSNIFSGNRLNTNQQLRAKKIQELIIYCQKSSQVGEAVDIGRAIFRTTLNLLSNTIFSKDLTDPYSDSGKEFKDLVWNMMVEAGKPNLVDYFPFLEKFDPQGIRRRLTGHFTKALDLFQDLIDERLEERKVKGNKNDDALDSLLNVSQERPEEIDRTHIQHMLLDLFAAGTDTSSSTIEWAMAELLTNPEIMAKAQAELADVIGKGKPIHEADVTRLPYLQCILKETFRMHPPVPFLIPRKVEHEVNLCGYTIPKDSQILVNVWAIGRDPNIWEKPLVFKPERFQNLEMDFRGQDFELIPFGGGRRICPGLPLAMKTVPVMLGSLLNSFQWKLDGNIAPKDLDMKEKFGITIAKDCPLKAIPIPI
ncbi:PREDICTED: geraniol 8-hydroxylase-like isoform X1 [Ipomoea nil]|uniref:geraniol 8-hydroxylase-like isoform X1 n=1 Tax=Ipomoea nil TaxID=35883 RepID=UPI000901F47C|nr:PREDICTED: geraniol 8-hydroxylase-like isoform X1 [Ipomoea nil]